MLSYLYFLLFPGTIRSVYLPFAAAALALLSVTLVTLSNMAPKRDSWNKKRKRSTEKQSVLKTEKPCTHHEFDDKLAFNLCKKWSWGHISATQLRQDCQDSYDGQIHLLNKLKKSVDLGSASLKTISAMGSGGKHLNNIARDLRKMLGESTFPQPHWEHVPCVSPKSEKKKKGML